MREVWWGKAQFVEGREGVRDPGVRGSEAVLQHRIACVSKEQRQEHETCSCGKGKQIVLAVLQSGIT